MRFLVCFVLSLGLLVLAACATTGAGSGAGDEGSRDSLETRRALAGMRHGAWESTYAPGKPMTVAPRRIAVAGDDG